MYEIPNWPTNSPTWNGDCLKILLESSTNPIPSTTIDNLISLSDKFPITFPINTSRCKTLLSSVDKHILERNINSAYPLIHESALFLYAKFLIFKRKFGTEIEKKLYKNMTIVEFVDRLLKKRAVMFMGKYDSYILLDNTKGSGKWDTIGKNNEKKPLTLENYISYDEIKLSVFLSVSSYSYFINTGSRKNNGIVSKTRDNIEQEGIVIGLIGARFKRINAMEYQETIITKSQNTPENGYGNKVDSLHNTIAKFYEEPCFTYKEAISKLDADKSNRFTKLQNEQIFDNFVYAKRLALSFDTLLLEANFRAKKVDKLAYVHVVGIGLGVWKASDHQKNVFVATFFKRLSILGSKLNNISDVDFSYFGDGITYDHYKDNYLFEIKDHPQKGIKIHVSKRDPYKKIDSSKLLVVSYAWDGNALPGNEYWKGHLGSTGDSSTASSTQVTEIHNPYINEMVSADNLMVVTPSEHIPIESYINRFKNRKLETDDAETSKKRKQ